MCRCKFWLIPMENSGRVGSPNASRHFSLAVRINHRRAVLSSQTTKKSIILNQIKLIHEISWSEMSLQAGKTVAVAGLTAVSLLIARHGLVAHQQRQRERSFQNLEEGNPVHGQESIKELAHIVKHVKCVFLQDSNSDRPLTFSRDHSSQTPQQTMHHEGSSNNHYSSLGAPLLGDIVSNEKDGDLAVVMGSVFEGALWLWVVRHLTELAQWVLIRILFRIESKHLHLAPWLVAVLAFRISTKWHWRFFHFFRKHPHLFLRQNPANRKETKIYLQVRVSGRLPLCKQISDVKGDSLYYGFGTAKLLGKSQCIPTVSPLSTLKLKFYCFKNNCNASSSCLRKLANHGRLAHLRHPLTGGRFSGDLVDDMSDDGELVEERWPRRLRKTKYTGRC